MTMRKTLDRKIEELKENIGKLSFDELEKLASEIVALSTMLGCKKEVLGELTEYFEEKLGLSEGTVVDVERTDYRDVIHLEVKSKLSAEVICDLVEEIRPDYAERFLCIEVGCKKGTNDIDLIILKYKGRKDIVIEADLTGLTKLDIVEICREVDTFLS